VPALEAAGRPVRCASRSAESGPSPDASAAGGHQWVQLDVDDAGSLDRALEGCDAAFYLVHGMAAGAGSAHREAEQAARFRDAAARAGLRRVVYLGGIEPEGPLSKHLASRLETGRILREGGVSTVELRACMVIGAGSASWQIVRDLAARLPAMVLPRWLRNFSQPIAIDDVVRALLAALDLEASGSLCVDLPGPELLSHKELLRRASAILGREAWMVDVPVLSPRLSSHWIRLVTRANWAVARELVEGLTSDLVAGADVFWTRIGDAPRVGVDAAIRQALRDEVEAGIDELAGGARWRLVALGEAHAKGRSA